jgi:molecular chaperone Hsp33
MDHLTRWIDRSASLRISAVDASATARSLCLVHGLSGPSAVELSEMVAGTLLLAADQRAFHTLSLQLDLGSASQHVDATAEGLVRAMATSRQRPSVPARLQARRLGPEGQIYHSVVESAAVAVGPILEDYLHQSEQQRSRLDLETDLDERGIPLRVRGALLRDFPKTPPELLERLFSEWAARGGTWEAASPGDGLSTGPWDKLGEVEVRAHCPCSRERALGALVSLGPEALEKAKAAGKDQEVVCDFCRTRYVFSPEEIEARLQGRIG